MNPEMTTLMMTATATAAAVIEPENLFRMMVSFCPAVLLQRVFP